MEFVALLEDLCDASSWVIIICRHRLNSHMEVVIKLTVYRNLFNSFIFKSDNQTFLYHF